jgi:phosphoribosylformylglycinamidine synthase subunit PurL
VGESLSETIRLKGVPKETIRSELARHGIRAEPDELLEVVDRLGRDLTVPEAFLFDVAYSEHCSYKSSRRFLRDLLPPLAPHVILGPGEDSGVVSLGEVEGREWTLVVAHESHNHPSQLLPVEGAATGIGGIVRDVYCMGADVVGVLDGLRFGDLDGPNAETCRAIVRGVVRGIWEYGNALGVPNIGGDLGFDGCYDDNCLVNVVALGVAPADRIIRSRVPQAAKSEPYLLVLIGKPTDRSGLGGASFASKILDAEAADDNMGAVQIHDPFLKRVLVEATKSVWELIAARGCAVGFKDLGAGGLAGASSELVVAGGFGAEIDLGNVPQAEAAPLPEHLLVAETQERFVWALPERIVPEVLAIYNEDFDLPGVYPGARAAVIGRVTEEPRYRASWKGETVVDLPITILDESPVLERPTRARAVATEPGTIPPPDGWYSFTRALMRHPQLCSRAFVYRHYDPEVRGEALIRPGEADAGVCRPIPGSRIGIAVSLDGNARWCDLDPYHGAAATVVEGMRNIVAVGARPLALTDCMNFGSPEDPECLWEFEQCLLGMRDACVALGLPGTSADALPIVSGNVSFYNQSAGGRRIRPTPILACYGSMSDWRCALRPQLTTPGNRLLVVGSFSRGWGGNPAVEILGGTGRPPHVDLPRERERIGAVLALIEAGRVASAHDFAEGGLLVGLLETLWHEEGPTGLGLNVDLASLPAPWLEALLDETGGFILEVSPGDEAEIASAFARDGIDAWPIGTVLDVPHVRCRSGTEEIFDLTVLPIWQAWSGRLGAWIEGEAR